MTNREIAALTEKNHKNVIRDIRLMLDELSSDGSDLSHVQEDKDARGYIAVFHLDRELTDTLLTGYSAVLRRRVVVRWRELEEGASQSLPKTFAQALRLAAEQNEQIEVQAAQLAIAAPKVAFVDAYVAAEGNKGFRQVAKLLAANERTFGKWLDDAGITYRLAGERTARAQHSDGCPEISGHPPQSTERHDCPDSIATANARKLAHPQIEGGGCAGLNRTNASMSSSSQKTPPPMRRGCGNSFLASSE